MSDPNPVIAIGDAKYLCIEYPGYVKNTKKAIDTMGGEKKISEALSAEVPIELRYRPKDIFSHPITGDLLPSAKLVLKVTRYVKKNSEGEVIEQDPNFQTEILGTVTKTVRFRSLADFQYLLPKGNKTRQLKEALAKGDVEKIMNYKIAEDDDDFDNLRGIPPPLFSPLEAPFAYNYRQNSSVIRVRARQPDGSYKIKLINRSKHHGNQTTSVRYEDDNIPSKSWHNLKALKMDMEIEAAAEIGKLFETRPIWTRFAITSVLHPKYHKYLSRGLVHHAYNLTSGPWRESWVRYGVDPRKDPKYHIYQHVDIRQFHQPGSRDAPQLMSRRQINKPIPDQTKYNDDESEDIELKKAAHIFDGRTVTSFHSLYQLCDIIAPDLTLLINNPDYLKPTCTKHSGFYYRCVFDRIRKTLRKKNEALKRGTVIEVDDIEEGMAEAIQKEIEKTENMGEEEERMDEDEEDSGSISTADVEKLAQKAYGEISLNKRLKDVVDDYMTELQNAESSLAKEMEDVDDMTFDMLEEYEEEIDEDELKETDE